MTTLYLTCFVLGFAMSVLATFTGLGRVHFGHIHFGHGHVHAKGSTHVSALNGFTLPAFLCWFGGAGYLLATHSSLWMPVVFLLALIAGFFSAALLYVVLFKFLIPHERVLRPEDTRMDGVLARVSDEIRPDGGTGEILFTQIGARKSAAARSETGAPIPRGTEVVVLRYARGIAYVSPLNDLAAHL